MKIFISQKMHNKSYDEICAERNMIWGKWGEYTHSTTHYSIKSYIPKLQYKNPIKALAQSLSYLADADVVLVPEDSVVFTNDMCYSIPPTQEEVDFWNSNNLPENFIAPQDTKLGLDFVRGNIKGCELELLVALASGKKVYYYDDEYNFTEVK